MSCFNEFLNCLRFPSSAVAVINGSNKYPSIRGKTDFYKARDGIIVRTVIKGLPKNNEICQSPIFAFHIHNGDTCTGNETDPFANANGHFNPQKCYHPYHAGDLPPLFSANGKAVSVFLTDRFNLTDIIGKTVIIHNNPDDFTTQPSGNSGEKIACGVIVEQNQKRLSH